MPNEYNLGAIVYRYAPKDATTAKMLAKAYRAEAAKLNGDDQNRLADINSILARLRTAFDSRTCFDEATCKAWDAWLVKRDEAMKAEQVRRKYFSKNDWYAALNEIAIALEAVK